ncbi:uncharacterized protein TrAtP1_011330 [Trichoderma atroviride]|uniref:uncharacterized protein n=1 Tax=Hypocrea atroviridis TaxID=63577 RepID=UPI00331A2BF5|nr:hypothetical protein TrAtP1_011330 [Trichoderma atroviride]
MAQKTTLKEFESVWPKLEEALLDHAKTYKLPAAELAWLKRNLEVNPLGGKCNRGMSVPDSVSIILGRPLTEEEYFKAATLGWMTELLQAFFLVSDDIMDSSITRRGQPCWYRQEGVGMIAINDSFLLEAGIYIILKKYFRDHPPLHRARRALPRELFPDRARPALRPAHRARGRRQPRQLLHGKVQLHRHPQDCLLFLLPPHRPGALHAGHCLPPRICRPQRTSSSPLGEYFQIQDDYLDNFGLPEHIGKIGTDIKDNKCSWLVNQALQLATPEQRKILEENYGQKDDAKEQVVKKLYDDMKLKERYQAFEEKRAGELMELINKIDESQGLKKQVFEVFLSKIYKRSK